MNFLLRQAKQTATRPPVWTADPRAVVCSVALCMVGTFLIHSLFEFFLALLFWLILCAIVKDNPITVFKNALGPALVLILITSLNLFFNLEGTPLFQWGIVSITTAGIRTFLLFSCRLTLLVLWGSLLLAALPGPLCARAVQSLLSPLRLIKIPIDALADVLVLSLRFLPVVGREYRTLREAQELRGKHSGNRATTHTGKRAAKKSAKQQGAQQASQGESQRKELHSPSQQRAIMATVVPLLRALLRHATNLSAALDSRAYEVGQKRTYLTSFSLRILDLTMCAVCGGFIVFLILSC